MKRLFFQILTIPLVAYFTNLITVAMLGSFMDKRQLIELLGGTNTMPIWLAWMSILLIITITNYIIKKDKTQ